MEKIANKLISRDNNPSPYFYEKDFWAQQAYVCGIDEVGRGCFAGPVVTAAVILKPFVNHPLLKDSKVMSESERNKAASWIKNNSWYSYGIIDAHDIDQFNIYKATQKAMKQAVYALFSCPLGPWKTKLILIDAMPLTFPGLAQPLDILSFPFGESRSVSIAAASIIAKVKRDELIARLGTLFPGYSFDAHRGYGTPVHQQALKAKGLSLIHRITFSKKTDERTVNDTEKSGQASLFC